MRLLYLFLLLALSAPAQDDPAARLANTVILDDQSIANLRIETVEAEEVTFEKTLFALGRIEVLPGKRAVLSSRIPGRAFSVLALPDQQVEEGDELVWVESRQPGDPPPTIMLPAPMAGVIAKVEIAVGQPVHPDQSLMEILDLGVVEASAQVPQHLAAQLTKGQKARIRVAGFPDKTFEATLAHLGAYADPDNNTLEAAFHLENPDQLLRPGLVAEFHIITDRRDNVMTIPREAVQGDASRRFVFIKDYELEKAFVKVPVVLGEQNDRQFEVVQGLFPGDEVVTRGAYSLAFAGKGSTSLREALDAAHGHPHNEDGTEMSKEQIAGTEGGHDHKHDDDHDHTPSAVWNSTTTFFAASTAVLLVLLILNVLMPRKEVAK
jgi:cobalt-zinc-cadmium efflux system membrane fusion protein